MYRPEYSDSDDDYDGFSFGDEFNSEKEKVYNTFKKPNDPQDELLMCVTNGNLDELIKIIDKNNFDINATLNKSYTLLHNSCKYGHIKIVEYLLHNGANCNKQVDSITPLLEACDCYFNTENTYEIVQLLLDHGAVVNISNKFGKTPLMFACARGHVNVVNELLKSASLEATDNEGQTALLHAIENNHKDIVKILLNKGANVTITNQAGYTPIQVAQFQGFEDILEILPKDEEKYFVPITHLTYNSLEDLIPRLFKNSETPEYFQEINPILRSNNIENVLENFGKNSISFTEFLTMTEKRLEEIGILYPFQRKRILLGILNYHLKHWNKNSITRIKKGSKETFYEILMISVNQLRHLITITSSIKFVYQNLSDHKFGTIDNKTVLDFQENLKKYKKTLLDFKKTVKYLRSFSPKKSPIFIDYDEYLAQNRKIIYCKYIRYSIILGLTVMAALRIKNII